MDIFSHGLWGGVIFGRKNRKSFWLSFFFGIAPDFFSFGIFMMIRLIDSLTTGVWSLHGGKPELHEIPLYVHTLYNITHSFLIFGIVFLLVWWIFKKPLWAMGAWFFHIFLDLFTHSTDFFPTPYMWPFSPPSVEGVPWSAPLIFFTNVFFLIVIYSVYWYRKTQYNKAD